MGFEFGLINSLDPEKSVYAFLGVVAFIIFFDYLSGVLEYFVEKSSLYHKMVKIIYKELMLMGLVALSITMYEANTEESEKHEESIEVIDFVHIVLFYVTIFFVLHAIFLMVMSLRSDNAYRQHFAESTQGLLDLSKVMQTSALQNYLFNIHLYPFCELREKIEFNIVHSIFQSTYALPKGFHFPAYLSGCYGRFALKAINRSLFTWIILLVIVICNYFRILSGFSCHIHKEIVEEHVERRLDFSNNNSDHECRVNTIRYFFVVGSFMILYTTIVALFSRLYKIRLLKHAGVSTPEEYLKFMKFKASYEEKQQEEDYAHSFHWTLDTLKKEIEEEMDAKESPDEEEEEFRSIALFLLYIYRRVKETFAIIRVELRVQLVKLFCPSRLENIGGKTSSLIKSNSARSVPVSKSGSIHQNVPNNSHSSSANDLTGVESGGVNATPRRSIALGADGRPALSKRKSVVISHQNREKLTLKQRLHRKNSRQPRRSTFFTHLEQNNPLQNSTGEEKTNQPAGHEHQCVLTAFHHHYQSEKQLLHNLEQRKQEEKGSFEVTPPPAPEKKPTLFSTVYHFFFADLDTDAIVRNSINVVDGRASMQDVINNRNIAEREFHHIYLFSKPILFFRAVELCIMANCLYLSIWLTNMITITEDADLAEDYDIFIQLAMLIPVLYNFYAIAIITETCSLLGAVSDLNLEVMKEVIIEMQESESVAKELRERLLTIARLEEIDLENDQESFVDQLFEEIDLDGSGTLDSDEFRELLRLLRLTYSDHKYRLLFYALDHSGDGYIIKKELQRFLFPSNSKTPGK